MPSQGGRRVGGGGNLTRRQFKTGGAAQPPPREWAAGAKPGAPQEAPSRPRGPESVGGAKVWSGPADAARGAGVTPRPSRAPTLTPPASQGTAEYGHAQTRRPRSRPAVWADPGGGPSGLLSRGEPPPPSLETRSQRPHSLLGPRGRVPPAHPASNVADTLGLWPHPPASASTLSFPLLVTKPISALRVCPTLSDHTVTSAKTLFPGSLSEVLSSRELCGDPAQPPRR